MTRATSRRTILLLAVAVVLAVSLASGWTLAGLVDTEELDAQLGAGSFDVQLSEVGPATADSTTDQHDATDVEDTWEDYSHPTDATGEVTNTLQLELTEASSAANYVTLDVAYRQNDTVSESTDDGNATAKTLEVVRFEYDGTELTGSRIEDANGNGIVDLHDAARADLDGLDGFAPGEPVALTITLRGDASRHRSVDGGDGLDVAVTVRTGVRDSWRDGGVSRNNTIQYAVE